MYENDYPEINSSGLVVWNRYDYHDNEIILFDGTQKVQLTSNGDNDNYPTINNKGEIAWERSNASGNSIIVYDGSRFTELTNSSRSAWGPQMNEHGSVVYQGWHGSNADIYIASRVSIISPGGGEPVPSGLPYTIRWAGPSRAVKYRINYSIDNGVTWNPAHQEPFVTGTTLNWGVPVPPGNKRKCLVEAIGFDVSGKAVSRDQSDALFTIEVVKLNSPNGGEPHGKFVLLFS
jgi:hypothetical protein